jgi:hypothetical protein
MDPMIYKILSCHSDSVQEGWERRLVDLLGSKPRRLSRWCELGLWGALSCVRKVSDDDLSSTVSIRVYSENGTIHATRKALAQTDEHLPMPVTFMQTLPGQLFNAIGAAVEWHGDGCTVAAATRQQAEVTMLQNVQKMALLAWVDEVPTAISRWILIERVAAPALTSSWESVASLFEISDEMIWLQLGADGKLFQAR